MLPEFCETELKCLYAIWQRLNNTSQIVPVTFTSSTPDIILIILIILFILVISIFIILLYRRVINYHPIRLTDM